MFCQHLNRLSAAFVYSWIQWDSCLFMELSKNADKELEMFLNWSTEDISLTASRDA